MIDLSGMKQNLSKLPERTEQALMAYGNTAAAKLQGEAQMSRTWTDRTAQAVQRIKGYCIKTGTGVRIYLAHGVDYGVYLEFAHGKKYAVIYPTLRREGPEIMDGAVKVINRRWDGKRYSGIWKRAVLQFIRSASIRGLAQVHIWFSGIMGLDILGVLRRRNMRCFCTTRLTDIASLRAIY